ncbi:MAG: hypothetical protein RIC14_08730 [Filomicrobium sp.]
MMSFFHAIRHVIGLSIAALLTVVAIYLSRFWIWTAPWSTDGLLAIKALSPFGDRIRAWLGGTWLWDFDILIWGCSTILALSLLQIIARRLKM